MALVLVMLTARASESIDKNASHKSRQLGPSNSLYIEDDPTVTFLDTGFATFIVLKNLPNLHSINSAIDRRYNFEGRDIEHVNLTNCGSNVSYIWVHAEETALSFLNLQDCETVTHVSLSSPQLELGERAFANIRHL
jgi:hypothetical protein